MSTFVSDNLVENESIPKKDAKIVATIVPFAKVLLAMSINIRRFFFLLLRLNSLKTKAFF